LTLRQEHGQRRQKAQKSRRSQHGDSLY
jgi:hypothetical protein